jgi:hypothetical protein
MRRQQPAAGDFLMSGADQLLEPFDRLRRQTATVRAQNRRSAAALPAAEHPHRITTRSGRWAAGTWIRTRGAWSGSAIDRGETGAR